MHHSVFYQTTADITVSVLSKFPNLRFYYCIRSIIVPKEPAGAYDMPRSETVDPAQFRILFYYPDGTPSSTGDSFCINP